MGTNRSETAPIAGTFALPTNTALTVSQSTAAPVRCHETPGTALESCAPTPRRADKSARYSWPLTT
jgi:hypothetical protein